MDYEKKYKEALEWMRSVYDSLHGATKEDAEHYFPELKENEDESIRKTIIRFFKDNYPNETEMYDGSVTVGKALAWLEKQGEKNINHIDIKEKAHQIAWETSKDYDPSLSKESWCEMAALDMASWLEKQGENKHTDEVEPKFKVGDKVTIKGDNTVYTIGIIAPDKTCWLKHGGREYGWATFGVLKHYVE